MTVLGILPTILDSESETPLQLVPCQPGVLRVIIYARISKLRSGQNSENTTSQVNRCLRELESISKDRGVKVVVVAIFKEDDRGASKYSKKPRPKWEHTLKLIEGSWADILMGTESERHTRRPSEGNRIVDLAETTDLNELYYTSDDSYDLSTPEGIYRARQAFNLAERESNKTSKRMRDKQGDRAEEGYSHGGRRAFAFKPGNLTLNERGKEYAGLRKAGELRLKGYSHKEIAYWLNDNGYRTTTGRLFVALTVRNMLRRLRYAPWPSDPTHAIRVHHGARYKAKWKPVWTPEEWERLQLINKLAQEKYSDRPKARRYLLTGFLYCGKCGMSLNGETKRDRPEKPIRPIYYCRVQGDTERKRGCGGVTRGAVPLEDLVLSSLFHRLDTPDLAKLLDAESLDTGRLNELLEMRTFQEQRIQDILDDYADGEMTREQKNRAKARADTKLKEIDDEIDQLNRGHKVSSLIPLGQTLRDAWENNDSLHWKRAIIGTVIDRIIVHPGGGKPIYECKYFDGTFKFDPDQIDIKWKA